MQKRKRSWSGMIGFLMLVVGAKLFFNTNSEVLPLWVSWMIGPLLWYGGFLFICYWFLSRIFPSKPNVSAERQTSSAQLRPVVAKRVAKPATLQNKFELVKPGMNYGKLALMGTTLALVVCFSITLQASPAADTAAESAGLFKTKCTMCHGPEADGKTAMGTKFGIRDMHSPDVQKQSDAELTQIIAKGKGKMPSYEGKLTPEQITQVVSFIRLLGKK